MWRAFFFAFGTMLIILGLECLVTESFIIQGARIPGIVGKLVDASSKQPTAGQFGANPGLAQGVGYPTAGGQGTSAFGPSRFNDQFAGPSQPAGNYYGGVPSSSQGYGGNSQFSLAGFGRQSSGNAPAAQPSTGMGVQTYPPGAQPRTRIFQPNDWMPWSLLAAGSLVVLYTNNRPS